MRRASGAARLANDRDGPSGRDAHWSRSARPARQPRPPGLTQHPHRHRYAAREVPWPVPLVSRPDRWRALRLAWTADAPAGARSRPLRPSVLLGNSRYERGVKLNQPMSAPGPRLPVSTQAWRPEYPLHLTTTSRRRAFGPEAEERFCAEWSAGPNGLLTASIVAHSNSGKVFAIVVPLARQ